MVLKDFEELYNRVLVHIIHAQKTENRSCSHKHGSKPIAE